MKLMKGLRHLKAPSGGSIVTIGVFDGVHRGHARVIDAAVKRARALGVKSIVVTFDPHPAKVVRPSSKVPSLISLDHRIRLIGDMTPDILIVLSFTKAFAALTDKEFAGKILAAKAGAKEVYIGDNFYFGKHARSGARELRGLGERFGFKVHVVKALKMGRLRISSSLIRHLIKEGRLHDAARFLGRPVSVLGTVVGGANLARELGYPTANLNPHHEVVPPSGVYAVLVRYKDRLYKGILNIGVRPTFYASRDREPAIEVHIFGFNGDIYGKDLEVYFIRKIRQERQFKGQESLVRQIKKDEKAVLAILRSMDSDQHAKLARSIIGASFVG